MGIIPYLLDGSGNPFSLVLVVSPLIGIAVLISI